MATTAPTYADIIRGMLNEQADALAQARAAADRHREPIALSTDEMELTRRTLVVRYEALATIHRRRVHVLSDLLSAEQVLSSPETAEIIQLSRFRQ